MKFGHWLNSLGFIDFLVLVIFLALSAYLTTLSFQGFKNWYEKKQAENPFAEDIRLSPFLFVGIALPYMLILYSFFGRHLTNLLSKIF